MLLNDLDIFFNLSNRYSKSNYILPFFQALLQFRSENHWIVTFIIYLLLLLEIFNQTNVFDKSKFTWKISRYYLIKVK